MKKLTLVVLVLVGLLVACTPVAQITQPAPSQSPVASAIPTQSPSRTFSPLPSPTLTQTPLPLSQTVVPTCLTLTGIIHQPYR